MLTSFDYMHRATYNNQNPFSGTIWVQDLSAVMIYSTAYSPSIGTVLHYTDLNVGLIAGHHYRLMGTSNVLSNSHDEVFAYVSPSPIPFPTAISR